MLLAVRLFLYAASGAVATNSDFATWDATAHVLSIHIDKLPVAALAAMIFGGSFAWSRVEKKKGGLT